MIPPGNSRIVCSRSAPWAAPAHRRHVSPVLTIALVNVLVLAAALALVLST